MNNLLQQREEELFWAKIFIYYLNRLGGFDYEAKSYQTSLIDVKVISQSKKYPALNMQLTWVKEIEFNPNKPPTKYLFFSETGIKDAIKYKTAKTLKKGEGVSDIILLLQGLSQKQEKFYLQKTQHQALFMF